MDIINVVFIFVSLCYPLGATFTMLKAVLKKSRDGGKGNKKDSGRNINKIFYNVDELCVINPAIGCAVLQQWCPMVRGTGSRSKASRRSVPCTRSWVLPGRTDESRLLSLLPIEVLPAGCVYCPASSNTARRQRFRTRS